MIVGLLFYVLYLFPHAGNTVVVVGVACNVVTVAFFASPLSTLVINYLSILKQLLLTYKLRLFSLLVQ